jgi:DNA end-binding protein Ku
VPQRKASKSSEEIVKGYEYAKGHHVLIEPQELDDLKLEAKHTIDMMRFVGEAEIDSRYWEKPYYLVPEVTRPRRMAKG